MRRDRSEIVCSELRGHAQRRWWRLTRDEVERLEGERELLIGRLQACYGRTRDQAAREVEEWLQGHVSRS